MNDDHEQDAAAEAFTGLRAGVERQSEEIVLLRRAIEGLAAAHPDAPELPDYSETLGRITQGISILMREGVKLGEKPALKLTPEILAAQIVAAGATARRADHDTITRAAGDLNGAARDMRGIVASALSAEQQRRHQLRYGLGGLVAGIVLWMLLPGLVARELTPASWQLPEKLARRNLGAETMWDGARQMAGAGSPAAWNSMIEGRALIQANRDALAKCRKAEAKADKPVKCAIMVGSADVDDRR